jgi:hypothetical protein
MAKAKTYEPTTGKSLREIVEERQVLDLWLFEQEGELTPELDALMRDQEADEKKKIEAVGYYIATEEEEIEAIKRQIARLAARRQAKENRIDWLKNRYLAEMLMKLGYKVGDAVKGAFATVRIQLNNPRIDGAPENPRVEAKDDEQQVLARWFREGVPFMSVREVYLFDRKAALAELQSFPGSKEAIRLSTHDVKAVRDESVRVA